MIARITIIAFLILVLVRCKNTSKLNDDFSVFLSHDSNKDTIDGVDDFNFGVKNSRIDSLYKVRLINFSNSEDSISFLSKEKIILNTVLRNGDSRDIIIPKELLLDFFTIKIRNHEVTFDLPHQALGTTIAIRDNGVVINFRRNLINYE